MLPLLDNNIWGIVAVPVGVTLCFGPALVVWLREQSKKEEPTEKPDKKPKR